MDYICKECNKRFAMERNYNKHMLNFHKITPDSLSYDDKIGIRKCCECSSSHKLIQDLIYHLESVHNVLIEEENLTFKNEADFGKWKRKVEQEDSCKYVPFEEDVKHEIGVSNYACNKKVSQYNCSCISNIKVVTGRRGNLSAVRVKTHYGHEIKSKPGRKPKIVSTLKNKVPEIYDIKCEEEKMDEEPFENENNTINTHFNLKNSIKAKLNIVSLNIDTLNNQKLVKLNSSLDSMCSDLGLSTKTENVFGQIIISNNSMFDHNYW
ncbi:unnamed protein product [Phyllotreta striolata]|uniref:C2H2-type domain-containing protein n=1 Tax=Phyllotreta striolata TaxID=444603 RepID=A0A9P0DJB3_PHYSR|nr:unnamed protein product [Phyllotreta striolata]